MEAYVRQIGAQLLSAILHASIYFKHQAFGAECEYRFLQIYAVDETISDLGIRGIAGQERRYKAFDWKQSAPEALKSILIGPRANYPVAKKHVEELLAAAGLLASNVSITQCKIPYRG